MKASKFLPLTWFMLGVLAADCVVTLVLIEKGLAYEGNWLRYIDLPMWLNLTLKYIFSALGLVVVEYFRYKYRYARKTAFVMLLFISIVYSAAILTAWTTFVIQYVRAS